MRRLFVFISFEAELIPGIADLELIPGDAAVYLTDTQKLGYLLSAIRHEPSIQSVYSQLQLEQLRGTSSFDQACRELHHRVEAMGADDYLDSRPGQALVSTEGKKNGQNSTSLAKVSCIARNCQEHVQPYLSLCKLFYLQCMAGKVPTLVLRDNLGNAVFNAQTKKLDFPPAVPQSRFPKAGLKKGEKLLVAGLQAPGLCRPSMGRPSKLNEEFETGPMMLLAAAGTDRVTIYVDSGAGQSLCSSSSAFADMTPCKVEISGVAGSLQAYGCGTAWFLAEDDLHQPFLLRIHNCLYRQGQFNLLSVSQICQDPRNSVDFNLDSPSRFFSTDSKRRQIRLPLFLEDGLFAILASPFQLDDPRFSSLRKVDVTPGGDFRPSENIASHRWDSRVLVSTKPEARFLVAQGCDYDYNLQSYCANFLAPLAISSARRQYDPAIPTDMDELTTRFFGLGTDRLKRTIQLSNGLATPANKFNTRIPDLKPFFPQGDTTQPGLVKSSHSGTVP